MTTDAYSAILIMMSLPRNPSHFPHKSLLIPPTGLTSYGWANS